MYYPNPNEYPKNLNNLKNEFEKCMSIQNLNKYFHIQFCDYFDYYKIYSQTIINQIQITLDPK